MTGRDPSRFTRISATQDGLPSGFRPLLSILLDAIADGTLPAQIAYLTWSTYDRVRKPAKYINPRPIREINGFDKWLIDLSMTQIRVADLQDFLNKRPIPNEFLTSGPPAGEAFRHKDHANYSAKLAAAVACWEFLATHPELIRGISVKQAAVNWLTQHAVDYDLLLLNGKPNSQGIDEIAKIVNWQPQGGAPKTPE
jgi:hypothetical protein